MTAPPAAARAAGGLPLRQAARRVIAVAVALARLGARVRAVRLLPQPCVVIDAPPPALAPGLALAAVRGPLPPQGWCRPAHGVLIRWSPARAARPRALPPTPRHPT